MRTVPTQKADVLMGDHRFGSLPRMADTIHAPRNAWLRAVAWGRAWLGTELRPMEECRTHSSQHSSTPCPSHNVHYMKTSLKLRIPRIKATLEVHGVFPGDFWAHTSTDLKKAPFICTEGFITIFNQLETLFFNSRQYFVTAYTKSYANAF